MRVSEVFHSRTKRVLLGLIGTLLSICAGAAYPEPASREFHFVVLGDSQFHDPIGYNRIINDVVLLQPAFVIQVGDLIRGYHPSLGAVRKEWQRFFGQIEPLTEGAGIPFVAVPGNHDVYGALRRPDRDATALFESHWGEVPRYFDYRGARFVVLNSDPVGSPISLGTRQLAWLEDALTDRAGELTFVFLHRPPASLDDFDAFHATLVKAGVNTVFYGHHHHGHQVVKDGVRYVMTNSAATSATPFEEVGSFDHVLQVSVRDEAATIAAIKAGGIVDLAPIDPVDNYDLFDLKQELAPDSVALADQGGGRFGLTIPLENDSRRSVSIYPSCDSADGRWAFEPRRLAVQTLAPGERIRLELVAIREFASESTPTCRLTIPYQTRSGEWLSYEQEVMTSLD